MTWQDQLNGDSLSWLLEKNNPGVRYLALRDLLEGSVEGSDLLEAQEQAYTRGPISAILDAMHQEGFREKHGTILEIEKKQTNG